MAVAVVALGVALFGVLSPRYRQRRPEFFRLPVTVGLIVALAGSGLWMVNTGITTPGWVAVGVSAWVVLEGIFALVRGRDDQDATPAT